MVGNSNHENNFPRDLLFTDTQVSKLCKLLANESSVNTNCPKSNCLK